MIKVLEEVCILLWTEGRGRRWGNGGWKGLEAFLVGHPLCSVCVDVFFLMFLAEFQAQQRLQVLGKWAYLFLCSSNSVRNSGALFLDVSLHEIRVALCAGERELPESPRESLTWGVLTVLCSDWALKYLLKRNPEYQLEAEDVCALDWSCGYFNMLWKEHPRGHGYLCEPQVCGFCFLSAFCWFCEVEEPDMQDIGWGWNILEDWKFDEVGGRGHDSCFCCWGKSKSHDSVIVWLVRLAGSVRRQVGSDFSPQQLWREFFSDLLVAKRSSCCKPCWLYWLLAGGCSLKAKLSWGLAGLPLCWIHAMDFKVWTTFGVVGWFFPWWISSCFEFNPLLLLYEFWFFHFLPHRRELGRNVFERRSREGGGGWTLSSGNCLGDITLS